MMREFTVSVPLPDGSLRFLCFCFSFFPCCYSLVRISFPGLFSSFTVFVVLWYSKPLLIAARSVVSSWLCSFSSLWCNYLLFPELVPRLCCQFMTHKRLPRCFPNFPGAVKEQHKCSNIKTGFNSNTLVPKPVVHLINGPLFVYLSDKYWSYWWQID